MGKLTKTVALVGMMGAGKSSLGRKLAANLDVPFCDADAEIEAAAGRSIADVFDEFGEEAFRDGERKVIARLLRAPPHVLAAGGGAFMDEETRRRIEATAFSVWIRVPMDVLVERVARRKSRPLLRDGDPREILGRLLQEREAVYATADLTVDSGDGSPGDAVSRVVESLNERGILA